MNFTIAERQLPIFRYPTRFFSGISHFSSSRQVFGSHRSPRVRQLERRRQNEAEQRLLPDSLSTSPPQTQNSAFEEWPVSVLKDSEKSSFLQISSRKAIKILDDFRASISAEELCSKYQIDTLTLTQIAMVLVASRTKGHYGTAQKLLMEASALKDPGATLILISQGLQYNKSNAALLNQPRKHFVDLVSAKNPTALFLQGNIHEAHGNEDLALEMYEESTTVSGDGHSGVVALDINLGDAWRTVGLLRKKRKDPAGTEEAFKKAALEFDDPLSYFYLATEFTDSSSGQYEDYLIQAASAGESKAIEQLGSYYFEILQKNGYFSHLKPFTQASKDSRAANDREGQEMDDSINGKPKELVLLEEWLRVGAEIKNPSSQVYHGILHRASEEHELGLECLDEASKSPEWTNTVAWLEKRWYSKDVDISNLNIEELRTKMDGEKEPTS